MYLTGRAVRTLSLFLLLLLALGSFLPGCSPWFTRTVYVPHGAAVRLRETLHQVKIWAKDEKGEFVPGTMDLPEGWYALPDPGETKNGSN